MTNGFSLRAVVLCCALGMAWALALPPHPATATGTAVSAVPGPTASPLSLLNASGTQVRGHPGSPAVPEVSALSWVVADADTGEVLAAHDAHRPLPPASTLKTLFALTVLPTLPGDTRHTVTREDLAGLGEGSSLVGVREGLTYRVSDLWRGVFLNSGNDAVHVLAALDGGVAGTVRKMQAKAHALGARDTHVVSPDGYDAPGQVSSAYDLAVFGRVGLQNPDFARYCGTASSDFPGDSGTYRIANTNRLLTGANGVTVYPGLIGVKNGYTTKAGNTLVAAARHGQRTLVVTVMNPQKGGGLAVYEEARSLLDWGFAASGRVTPVGSLLPERPSVRSGATTVPASNGAHGTGSHWPEGAALAGAVGVGVGAAVALVLRLRNARIRG
ncbi:D-alanyl-D-alanine carboxypeptidase (penicillin-binding protein 5/6) [Streptomyces nodosus]|uniref:D-alanyl-D-alanine carboxypeptidase n=1 Tax=Streptomyces nodosus TaxID=40318 RepID=A0A5P2WCM0_9ACTN|nr:serine hydrolase [Streptomyces nodosus]MBB4795607.1 D-alanyl-D-alanine carboxypeptidase (penicillin-binding protein 5/6) [Streptomyces nodosus]QEV42522.1 D-alanyl-D-alanine carboxypeptidase [Streptomyces nodosus]